MNWLIYAKRLFFHLKTVKHLYYKFMKNLLLIKKYNYIMKLLIVYIKKICLLLLHFVIKSIFYKYI
jgi:hypothetical protein